MRRKDPRARIVEAPGMLWHLRRDGEAATLCGEPAADWPLVLHWATSTGITCGVCLFALGVLPIDDEFGEREPA